MWGIVWGIVISRFSSRKRNGSLSVWAISTRVAGGYASMPYLAFVLSKVSLMLALGLVWRSRNAVLAVRSQPKKKVRHREKQQDATASEI